MQRVAQARRRQRGAQRRRRVGKVPDERGRAVRLLPQKQRPGVLGHQRVQELVVRCGQKDSLRRVEHGDVHVQRRQQDAKRVYKRRAVKELLGRGGLQHQQRPGNRGPAGVYVRRQDDRRRLQRLAGAP